MTLAATCPECSGAHVHDIKFNHRPDCEIGAKDAVRRVADQRVGKMLNRSSFTRRPMLHELALLRAIGWKSDPAEIVVTDYGQGVDAAGNPFHSTWIRGVTK